MARAYNITKNGGRKKKFIDWNLVEKLLTTGCSGMEIAAHIGIHFETLYERCSKDKGMSFSELAQEKKRKGVSLLRAKQFDLAMKGDRTMLVWLGKNRMGQAEKVEQKIESNVTQKAIIELPDNGNRYTKNSS